MQSILCEKSRGVLCIEGNYTPAKLRRTAVDAMGLFVINFLLLIALSLSLLSGTSAVIVHQSLAVGESL